MDVDFVHKLAYRRILDAHSVQRPAVSINRCCPSSMHGTLDNWGNVSVYDGSICQFPMYGLPRSNERVVFLWDRRMSLIVRPRNVWGLEALAFVRAIQLEARDRNFGERHRTLGSGGRSRRSDSPFHAQESQDDVSSQADSLRLCMFFFGCGWVGQAPHPKHNAKWH